MGTIDDAALELASLLADNNGVAIARPGELISMLASRMAGREVRADASDRAYLLASLAIRRLEELGMVQVSRTGDVHSERGNRLYAVRLTVE